MARIRSIKPEFCSSADTGALSREARLFFLQILTEADDEGRFLWLPRRLSGLLYPFDDEIGPENLDGWAQECQSRGMLILYKNGEVEYAQIANWAKHQRINRASQSRLPSHLDKDSVIVPCGLTEGSVKAHVHSSEHVHREQGTGNREQGTGNRESSLRSDSSTASPPTDLLGPKPNPTDLAARRAERTSIVTEDAIEAYNRIMATPTGKLSRVSKVGRKTRRKQVARMLTEASEICADQFGDKRVTPQFWQAYFDSCAEDPFCNGTGPYTAPHENWRPGFEYLTRPDTVVKVFEKSVAADDMEAAA